MTVPNQVGTERRRSLARLAAMAGIGLLLGLLSAVIWAFTVDLPGYTILGDGGAVMGERDLVRVFCSDSHFVIIGAVVGLVLGTLSWLWFKDMGWPVPVLAVVLTLASGVICWQVGRLLGPGPLDERLAAAKPGDIVPIALELRSTSALAVWAFAAVTPVLFGSAIVPEERNGRFASRRGRQRELGDRTDEGGTIVNEQGVAIPEPVDERAPDGASGDREQVPDIR